jgi:hypothetical protein
MPKWLQGMVLPTLMLWLYLFARGIVVGFTPYGQLSGFADQLAGFALAFVISWWVLADARKRERHLCYDYGFFAFFFWPVVVPVYLFRTRGARAFLTLLCFAGLWLIAGFISMVAFWLRWGGQPHD